jgi:hypothetical protein
MRHILTSSTHFFSAVTALFLCGISYADELPTQLRITHALRIPHQTITIDLAETNGAVVAKVKTNHMTGQNARGVPELEKEYKLTSGQSVRLRQLFAALDLEALRHHRYDLGLDGQDWTISYRDRLGSIDTIKIWSPYANTEERGLQGYLALFAFALDTVGFNPKTTYPQEN